VIDSATKLFDKSFVIGYFLPTLLFTGVVRWLWAPFFGCPEADLCKSLNPLGGLEKATVFTVLAWFLAILLSLWNYQLVRFLEGYSWPPLIRELGKRAQRRRFRSLCALDEETRKRRDQFKTQLAKLESSGVVDQQSTSQLRKQLRSAQDAYSKSGRRLRDEFPPREEFVLPTSFGNRVRAFESYPKAVYGADAIAVWRRLLLVASENARTAVDEAQANVNFWINTGFLAVVVALFSLLTIAASLFAGRAPGADTWKWAGVLSAAVAVAVGGYYFARERISGWSGAVKAVFDCYLPELAKQLGYELPNDHSERRKFWEMINVMILYQDPLDLQSRLQSDGRHGNTPPTADSPTR
jgi:hypothetical protein